MTVEEFHNFVSDSALVEKAITALARDMLEGAEVVEFRISSWHNRSLQYQMLAIDYAMHRAFVETSAMLEKAGLRPETYEEIGKVLEQNPELGKAAKPPPARHLRAVDLNGEVTQTAIKHALEGAIPFEEWEEEFKK